MGQTIHYHVHTHSQKTPTSRGDHLLNKPDAGVGEDGAAELGEIKSMLQMLCEKVDSNERHLKELRASQTEMAR